MGLLLTTVVYEIPIPNSNTSLDQILQTMCGSIAVLYAICPKHISPVVVCQLCKLSVRDEEDNRKNGKDASIEYRRRIRRASGAV